MGLGSPTPLLVGSTRPPVPLVVAPAKAKLRKPLTIALGGRAQAIDAVQASDLKEGRWPQPQSARPSSDGGMVIPSALVHVG